jgi:hypothetical protein
VEELPEHLVNLGLAKLSPVEKSLLWQRHIDKYINNDRISPALKIHALKLRAIVNEKLFEDLGSTSSENFLNKFEVEWFAEPLKKGLFTKDDLLLLATTFGMGSDKLLSMEREQILDEVVPVVEEGDKSCNCYYSLSCPGNGNSCIEGGCKKVDGCGLLGTTRCDGLCEL